VTVAFVLVLKTVTALPDPSVVAPVVVKLPAVVENDTSVDGNALPFTSNTLAVIVDWPPVAGTSVGFADMFTRPTAALPTRILTTLLLVTDAPPDRAVIVAVPDCVPARNVTLARPLTSVEASPGWNVPSDVVKDTCVPLWGGVPAGSITCAVMVVDPFTGRTFVDAINVIDDPDGARSGTFSQETLDTMSATARPTAPAMWERVII
jgi:hypothetical protein